MKLSFGAQKAISMLKNFGFEAYAVGGCVRDSLLGENPQDFDIATSAKPNEIKEVFKNEHLIETGIKHGTVTVLINGEPLEITTFRIDKDYFDHRRPGKVEFTDSLENDLARRDFTINAMAYDEKIGIIDCFGGKNDLEHGIIRTVGDPDRRFDEDALRIMRALRFSSTLEFKIEKSTADSISKNKSLLKNVSGERIFSEFSKLLCGKNAAKVIFKHEDVIFEIIPELAVLKNQTCDENPENLSLFEYNLSLFEYLPKDLTLRLTVLFNKSSAETVKTVLKRFNCSERLIKSVSLLICSANEKINPKPSEVKKLLQKLEKDLFEKLLLLIKAKEMQKSNVEPIFEQLFSAEQKILSEKSCYSLKSLAVNGNDLINAGIKPDKNMGKLLEILLEKVIEDEIPNEKERLISLAKELN